MSNFRIEKDSMGEVKVPSEALYGAQTQRAVNNFSISGLTMPTSFIGALALIKLVAAQTNQKLGLLSPEIANAIAAASQQIIDGQHLEQFPIDVFQTGSGTSSNMNANEVIARLASDHCEFPVSANDHVNMGQSSNDVIPTAIHLSAVLQMTQQLLPSLDHLNQTIQSKAHTLENVIKTGRTHLMDAMPVSMSQELLGWSAQLNHAKTALKHTLDPLLSLAQGGTAVGTGINAHPQFAGEFCQLLSAKCGLDFAVPNNFFALIGSQDIVTSVSGQLKVLAVTLMKIANDLRWMNSGPLAGLGEISLPALQPGSSIMPGKVNPVIPEAVTMVAAQVIGNDTTITVAAQSGNFELNVMLPVISHNLLQSIELLSNCMVSLADKAIEGFTVNHDKLNDALTKNPILVTALNPLIGYLKAADIAKKAYAQNRPIIDVAEQETDLDRETLTNLLDPAKLTLGGVYDN
jgi:fumarate hydratase class II